MKPGDGNGKMRELDGLLYCRFYLVFSGSVLRDGRHVSATKFSENELA